MKLSLVVLNYKTASDTLECLKSLKQANVPPQFKVETIVVDNGSGDDSVELISVAFPEIKLIQTGKNLGFAGGNNVGIKQALVDAPTFIMLLNSDTIVQKSFYRDLARMVKKCNFDIASPLIYFAPGFEFHPRRYKKNDLGKVIWYAGGHIDWDNVYGSHVAVDEVDHGQLPTCSPTDFVTGACILLKPKVIRTIGYLNEDYYLYLEDLEYCLRARNAGFSVGFISPVHLWHKVSVSSGGIGSSLSDYFITRNRLLLGFKYASWRTRLALLRQSLGQLISGTTAQRVAIVDFLLRRLGQGSWLK